MVKVKDSLPSKLWTLFLVVSILIGMIPTGVIGALAAQDVLGTIETLVSGGTIDQNTVTFNGTELAWSPKDDSIGRNVDGWWIGIKVTAPEGMTEDELKLSKYISNSEKLFWDVKDSVEGAEAHYIELWGVVNEAYLNDAIVNNKMLEYKYQFDWDADGVYEQPIIMKVDPKTVVLKKDSATVYPSTNDAKASVEVITGGVTINGNQSNVVVAEHTSTTELVWTEADTSAGRNSDGWWVGVNVIAPSGADLTKVNYQNKTSDGWGAAKAFNTYKDTENSIQLWGLVNETYLNSAVENNKNINYQWRFDWDGDGVYEQLVHIKLDPSKIVLKAENGEQVYPYLATVTPLTGGSVSGNTSNLELTIEETSLNWSPADASIGRNYDGWWVGMKVAAPEGYTDAQLQNTTYKRRVTSSGGNAWSEYSTVDFWTAKDSTDDADTHYVEIWMVINPSLIETYKTNGTDIKTECAFDWDNDGVYEQTITMSVVPSDKIVLNKVEQTGFEFSDKNPADKWVGESYTNTANGGQGTGEITYSIVSGADVADIDTATGKLTFKQPGTVTVKATKAADDIYSEVSAEYTVKAIKYPQVNFKFENSNSNITVEFKDGTYTNGAIGGNGNGAVVYELTSGDGTVATIDATTGDITFIKAGEVTVKATKAADANYNEATVTYTLTIEKSQQEPLTIVDAPANITYSPSVQNVFSVSGGSGNGVITYSIVSGQEYASIDSETGAITTIKAGGSFTVQVDKTGDDGYEAATPITTTIYVDYANQTGFGFDASSPDNITFDVANNTFVNKATGGESTGEITYAFVAPTTVAEITDAKSEVITILTAGTFTVIATKAGDDCYNAVTAEYTLTVDPATPVFNVSNAELVYGTKEYTISPDTILGGSGKYVYSIVGTNKIGATVDENGKVIFSDSDAKVGTITVNVKKEADAQYVELEKEITISVAYLTTTEKPTISGEQKDATYGWYSDDIIITAPSGYMISYDNELSTDDWAETVIYSTEDTVGKKNVYLKNDQGITDVIEVTGLLLDKTAPDSLAISYTTSRWERFLEVVTFGYYESDTVIVTLTAKDNGSGINNFVFNYGDGEAIPTVDADGIATYSFEALNDYRDKISFTAYDKAGNATKLADDKVLVIDKTAPTLTVSYEYPSVYKEENDILYTNGDTTIHFEIEENNFDLSLLEDNDKPKFVVNNSDVILNWVEDATEGVWEATYTFVPSNDYVISFNYEDLSKNTPVSYEKEIRVDDIKPEVEVMYTDGTETQIIENVKYYKSTQTVEIVVTEHNFRAEKVNLKVTADGADISSKKYAEYVKNPDNWTTNGDVHTLNTAGMIFDLDAKYSFDIDCHDFIENSSIDYIVDEFYVDHNTPTDITISYSTPLSKIILDKILETISFGFYNAEFEVTLTAKDVTSGVDYFEWSYTKDGESDKHIASYGEKITTDAITYDGDKATAVFKIPANARGYITAKAVDRAGNSDYVVDNNIVNVADDIAPEIEVTYTPVNNDASIHYIDVNRKDTNDVNNAEILYFDGDVTAKVKIDEANFFEGETSTDGIIHQVGIKLIKTDENGNVTEIEYLSENSVQRYPEATPEYISWSHSGDEHWFEIPYDEEVDYQLVVEYTDYSENKANITSNDGSASVEKYTSKIITVDKTTPIVEVEYKNTDVKSTYGEREYFTENQVAVITVTEHNFRADDFVAEVVAKYSDDTDVVVDDFKAFLSNEANWTKDENVYTATVNYTEDANYTFDFAFKDLALNDATDYETDYFTVDKENPHAPTVTYKGDIKTTIIDKVLNVITFGYYDAKVTVVVTSDDDVSGIDHFVYSYIKNEGVSDVNSGLENVTITSEDVVQEGKTFKASFEIPKDVLKDTNQFNGTVKFTAFDRATRSNEHKETANIVVDNIAPSATITYNEPVKNANGISYYAGDINATIVITEANFFSEDAVVKVTKDDVEYPVKVNWVDDSADVHTGTFTLTENGDYIVTVEYIDRSSNELEKYTSNRLTLDTVAPTISLSNVKNNSANKDDVYGFTISAKDINLDSSSFKPTLTAVVMNENGTFSTKTVSLGNMITVESGKEYSFNVQNLENDAIYSFVATVKDMSGNEYSKIILADGREYDKVNFSINRNGSTFGIGEYTEKVVNDYYVQNITENIVVFETNADNLSEYKVTLNGKELTEGTDYTVTTTGGNGSWMKYTYSVNKALFANEGEYSLVVSSKDKAQNDAFSDVKNAKINFVVDRTAPIITVTGMAKDGRYQTDVQTVTIIPTDDGGALNSIVVRFVDKDGNQIKEIINLSGEALEKALSDGNGRIEFEIAEGLYQNVQIICNDCAVDENGNTNTYNETFTNISVSSSAIMIFWANKPLRWGSIAGVLLLTTFIIFFMIVKKRKSKENNK